jgi:hypothetical protein
VRPLNLGETLDASIKIVRAQWRALATVMLVVGVPIQVATVVITATTIDDYKVGSGLLTPTSDSGDGSSVGGDTAILALMILGYLFGTVACYRLIGENYLGRATGAADALRYAADRLGSTLWLGIMLIAGVVAGLFAFVLPGIWLAVTWSVAYPAMLVEGTGGVPALQRSTKLVQGRWWATAGRLVVAIVLVTVISAVIGTVLISPFDDTSTAALIVEAASNLVVSLFATPFLAAVAMLVYFDLRARKEGWAPDAGVEVGAASPSPQRDAFGHPVAPRTGAPATAPPGPAPPRPGDAGPEAAAPEGWAPPVAPEPRKPPLWDPHPDRDDGV